MNTREGKDPLGDPQDGHPLTLAIIDTIREPLIVLSDDLRVVVASRAFYKKFNLTYENTRGKSFYDLGEGQWNIPAFRTLLEDIVPKRTTIEEYEVVHDFPKLGFRTLRVNAREIKYKNSRKGILLSILDITEERAIEMHKATLMHQKDTLLKEMRHRIANSLQLIASIILLKAETVQSEESRIHLEDAHDRILSIATVQRNLDPVGDGHEVPVVEYLRTLSQSIGRSMIGGRKPITITVSGSSGSVLPDEAIGLGLITTELVINALKHAFPSGEGNVVVSFIAEDDGWTLAVRDDGIGMSASKQKQREGLGTNIVESLAKQLNAAVIRNSTPKGTTVSIIRAPSASGQVIDK
ncbi:MAG: sensor histidine kinase [Minisyncoccota bacterium]